MKAELISIGDEILIGQIVNTNSVFLAKEFNRIGVEIAQITAISDQKNIIIDASPDLVNFLTKTSFDPQFGARPVKRIIQKLILNPLSKSILSNEISNDDPILIDCFDGKVVFRKQKINLSF